MKTTNMYKIDFKVLKSFNTSSNILSKLFYYIIIFINLLQLQSCVPIATIGIGTTAVSAIQRPNFKDNFSDMRIFSIIKGKIGKKHKNLIHKVHVKVLYGTVILTGVVKSQESVLNILDIVWEVEGVQEVINGLQIIPNNHNDQIAQYFLDRYIELKIRMKLSINKNVKSLNYDIRSINNIVYLTGIADNLKEQDLIEKIIMEIHFIKDIKNYTILKEELKKKQI